MALNKDFKIKDSLYVGGSARFVGTGGVSIDTNGRILSGGRDLIDIFQSNNLALLSGGDGISSFSYDGDTNATVAVDATVVRTTGVQTISGIKTFAATPVFNYGVTVTGDISVTGNVDGRDISVDGAKLDTTYTTVNANSASWGNAYNTVNYLSGSWNTSYATTNSLSSKWNTTYDTVNSLSANWNSSFNASNAYRAISGAIVTTGSSPSQGTVRLTQLSGGNIDIDTGLQNTDSPVFASLSVTNNILVGGNVDGRDISVDGAKLDSTFTSVNANSASWSLAYTAYNAASANIVNNGSVLSQGTVRLTRQNGTTIDIDTGLQTTDSPQFAGLSAGNVQVGITNDNEIDTASGNLIIDSAGGLTTITDNLSTTGSVTTSGLGTGGNTDSVVVKNADSTLQTRTADSRIWGSTLLDGSSLTTGYLTKVSDSNTLVNSIVSESGSVVTIAGSVSAAFLSGDGSALTNVLATAIFPSTELLGLTTTDKFFVNDGSNKFINYCNLLIDVAGAGLEANAGFDDVQLKNVTAFTNNYYLKWDSGNSQLTNTIISDDATTALVNGNLTVKGNTILGDSSADRITLSGSTIYIPNIATGTDNSVVVYNGSSLVTDEIDPKVWDIKLVDYGTLGQNYIPVATNSTGTIGNSIIQQTGGGTGITVSGNATITGNLSVTGDFTYIDTTVVVTSAMTISNAGTGPALKVSQSGVQPIAQFIDTDSTTIIFANDGYVGIGIPLGGSPSERLTVSGNISGNGTLKIDSTATIGSTLTLNGVAAGTDNTVLVLNASNQVIQDEIDPRVWGTTLVDGTGTANTIARWTDADTLANASITDNGTSAVATGDFTVRGNTILGDSSADRITLSGSTIYTPNIAAGTDNSVVVYNGTSLVTDEIDAKVWDNLLVDYTFPSTVNALTKFTDLSGTIGSANITDNGTVITFNEDISISGGYNTKHYATGNVIYKEENVWTGVVATSGTTVATFTKTGLESAKYIVTLAVGSNRTTFEVLLTYNGTDAFGTVYAIVDAQATSQLVSVDTSVASTTVDLVISSANNGTTATIHGVGYY